MCRNDLRWLAAAIAVLLAYWFVRVVPYVDRFVTFAGSDLPFQFLPDYSYLAERMQAGTLPLWNPLHGQPFLATLLPGTFYPARLLLLLLDVPTAMHVSTLLHLVLSLGATFALCRVLGTGVLGALTGAAVFTGVHALPALYWPPFLEGGAWLPVAALALTQLAATAAWRWAVVLGLAMGLCVLAGCYQHALYAAYALAVLGAALFLDPARRRCLAMRAAVPRLAVAVVVAVATAAPQALPTLAWSAETVRSGTPLTDEQLDPYPLPGMIWNWMFPGWGQDDLVMVTTPVAVLTLVGCLAQRRSGAVLLVATVTSILLCLGRGTPAFALFRVLPGFSSFRIPDRLIFLVGFFTALGAALGVDHLARGGRVARAVAIIGFAAVCWNLFAPRRIGSALPWTLPPASLGGPPPLMSLVERHTAGGRTLLTGERESGIAVKQTGLHHVRNLEDYNPLSSRRLAVYLYAVVGKPPPGPENPWLFSGFLSMNEPIVRPELLDMAAVRTVLVKTLVGVPPRLPAFRRLGTIENWTLYENPLAFPRAFTVERARLVPDDAAALEVVRSPGFDARREVVLMGRPNAADSATLAVGRVDSLREARIVDDEPEHVGLEVRTERPAVLVLTDTFAPGWSATVNGRAAPILPANYLGRGVVVPAGDSRVEFVYHAPGLVTGVIVMLLGWGAVAAGAVIRARRARLSPRAARR